MKSDSIAVSVLITFYNQEECVVQALKSVTSQETSFDFEILIGDDGSSDKTYQYVNEWEEKFPSMIHCFSWPREQEKQYEPIIRVSANRLELLARAKGDYVVFLDGDDYFTDKNKLQLQYDILLKNSKYNSCCHDFCYVNSYDSSVTGSGCTLSGGAEVCFSDYWQSEYLPAECFMFKRPSRDEFLEIKKWHFFDDNNIVYFLARKAPTFYIDKSMIAYVQEENGSWMGRPVAERNIAGLIDYFLEIEIDSSFEKVSRQRHLAELLWLLRGGYSILVTHVSYKILSTYSMFLSFEKKYFSKSVGSRVRKNVLVFRLGLVALGKSVSKG